MSITSSHFSGEVWAALADRVRRGWLPSGVELPTIDAAADHDLAVGAPGIFRIVREFVLSLIVEQDRRRAREARAAQLKKSWLATIEAINEETEQ